MNTYKAKGQAVSKFVVTPRMIGSALIWTFLSYRYWQNPLSAFRFFMQIYMSGRAGAMTLFHLGRVRFYARPIDHVAFKEVMLRHEYAFIRNLFQKSPPKIIIDLGANIGLFSAYMLSLWPSSQVHAVEASKDTSNVLDQNRSLNSGLDWHTYHYAIWNENSEIGFEVNESSSTGSHVTSDQTREKVPAITFDTFFSMYLGSSTDISLVKMDIEGSEEAVLRTSLHLLDRVENLVVEVHPNCSDYGYIIWLLHSSFRSLYQISGRRSSKPLLLASNQTQNLPFYRLEAGDIR